LDSKVIEKYIEAGRIASRVRDEAHRYVKPGARLLDICEAIENRIRDMGGQPAFPCNISVNEVAAHYSPLPMDNSTIPPGAVVKIDLGVHVDGYIADTARTVVLSPRYEDLAEASRRALDRALEMVSDGVRFRDVGRVIEETIKSMGFKPIRNLTGHSLDRYTIHAGESIPNVYERLVMGRFRAGRAYAIEPFATNGLGFVVNDRYVGIYSLARARVKGVSSFDREVFEAVKNRFRTLPFTPRWLLDLGEPRDVVRSVERLASRKAFHRYPILVEAGGGLVAQFEHTLVVLRDEVIITTKS